MPSLIPGASFGAYRLIRPLGKGGFAEVWEAEHAVNGRRVALKVLTELRAGSERGLERFQQEGRLAASLANPHCVYVFDAGAFDGFPYIAMELVAGGTLADRLERGPLGAREAVDVVLDVLEGLESAQQTGILHRDVKPSNVFLDAAGRAKIGDFGISKSLEADSKLSQTGAFLGTPYYASPEQIAAEPLDLRSDLYSVGAMLYELVTGKLPYQGTNASAVLAQVLTREPVPFAESGVAVPPGLQRVILRCLAKQKERRFQSYAQLRAALLPFSSRGAVPAARAPRFAAILVDTLLYLLLGIVAGSVVLSLGLNNALTSTVLAPLNFLYFTLTERFWGGSVGKHLLGLRVTGADGTPPSLGRVAGRTAVFLLCTSGPGLLAEWLTAASAGPMGSGAGLAIAAGKLLGIAVLLTTMRRRNGYAGVHELASGTRVVSLLTRERAGAVPRATPAATPVSPPVGAYGPYRVTGTLWRRGAEALLLGHDAELQRDVWVHELGDGAAAPPVETLRARGEGSLPWLQRGTREDGVVWDAYGAPQGTSLARWAAARRGLGWREMRDVLLSLSRELESRFAREGDAGTPTPQRVWVDPSGRALLLDFPVDPAAEPPPERVTPATACAFLARVAALGLAGRAGEGALRVPLPHYARGLIEGLSETGAGGAPRSNAEFAAALEAAASRPAEVSRWRRAGPYAVLSVVPTLVVLLHLLVPLMTAGLPPWYRDIMAYSDAYHDAVQRADSVAPSRDSVTRRTIESAQVVFAAAMRDARRNPRLRAQLLGALPPGLRSALDSAAAREPAPDSQQVAAARAWLTAHVAVPRLSGGLAGALKGLRQSLGLLGWLGAAGAILALALRGGFLFTLFGIVVVRADGAPAGRLRCCARALAGWAPLLLVVALAAAPAGLRVRVGIGAQVQADTTRRAPPAAPARTETWLVWTLGAIALAGAGAAVWRPSRGVAERASGVVLVPK